MWKNANFRLVVGIIGALLMTVIFVFEVRIGFNIFQRKILNDTEMLTQISKDKGSASVSIDQMATYPEVEGVDPEGDVIKLYNYDIKVKLNGVATDVTRDSYGVYKYAQSGTNAAMTLSVESYKSDKDKLMEAYDAYLYGYSMALPTAIGLALKEDAAKFLVQSYREGPIPIIYSEGTQIYTAFVPLEEDFIVLSAKDPFLLDTGKVSVHYGNPSEQPMLMHTYSDYEELASKNQIAAILENKIKNENGELDAVDTPYQSTAVVGTDDTYTSRADNTTRAQLVSYADYDWQEDGVAAGTSMMIDTTSVRAKESEWKLTETVYSYSYAGLQLMNLSGQRSSSTLTISGNIVNELESERPYVIVVKFIGEGDTLLGLNVVDGRETPLAASTFKEFSVSASSSDMDIANVVAVQFEIY